MGWSGKLVSLSERYQPERWMHLVGEEFAGIHFVSVSSQVIYINLMATWAVNSFSSRTTILETLTFSGWCFFFCTFIRDVT